MRCVALALVAWLVVSVGAVLALRFVPPPFTATMLDEGAGKYNALDLADAIEFLGASLTTGSSFDSSVMNLHTPASKLDPSPAATSARMASVSGMATTVVIAHTVTRTDGADTTRRMPSRQA